jgi:hypothetical protein
VKEKPFRRLLHHVDRGLQLVVDIFRERIAGESDTAAGFRIEDVAIDVVAQLDGFLELIHVDAQSFRHVFQKGAVNVTFTSSSSVNDRWMASG